MPILRPYLILIKIINLHLKIAVDLSKKERKKQDGITSLFPDYFFSFFFPDKKFCFDNHNMYITKLILLTQN